ncbi:hypothetical protein ACFY40_21950 [Streptomyces sp. NPDC012950]|uniref:hypothetical protein n=1 Tax=Streptomyces sp. NPDC012950 TaxID=3364858 RepID=UPI00369AC056
MECRAVAAPPEYDRTAVTRGGHGEADVVALETGHEATRLRPDTPLHHGGTMMPPGRGDGADGDRVGR